MRGRAAALALVALGVGAAVAAPARAELPLGREAFTERSRTVEVVPGLSWTRIARSGGPWRVNVLTIDRGALAGRVTAGLSNSRVAGRERLSAIARRTRALAGVNGGFFAVDGDPVGTLVVRGRLVSEPVGGWWCRARPATRRWWRRCASRVARAWGDARDCTTGWTAAPAGSPRAAAAAATGPRSAPTRC